MSLPLDQLFADQVHHLEEVHFLVLFWTAQSEGAALRYNITNCFDDLKHHAITRTKQTAVAAIEALAALRFLDLRGEGNRKNLYITTYGAKALETLILERAFDPKPSAFLEAQ